MRGASVTLGIRVLSWCRPELLTLRSAVSGSRQTASTVTAREAGQDKARMGRRYPASAEECFSASTAHVSLHFHPLRRSASRAAIPHNNASSAELRVRLAASLKSILKPTSRRQGHVRCRKRPCAALSADAVWTTQLEETAKGFDKCSGLIRTTRVRPTSLQQTSHTAGA